MSLNQNAFALIMQEYEERQRRIRDEIKRKKEFIYERNRFFGIPNIKFSRHERLLKYVSALFS